MSAERQVVLASLLVKDDYIFIDRRKYRVLSTSRVDNKNVRLLLERKGMHHVSVYDIYDTFRTIPSPKLEDGK